MAGRPFTVTTCGEAPVLHWMATGFTTSPAAASALRAATRPITPCACFMPSFKLMAIRRPLGEDEILERFVSGNRSRRWKSASARKNVNEVALPSVAGRPRGDAAAGQELGLR